MSERRVYFLRPVGQEGPIKIGHSRWPEERLRALMGWSPVDLEIIATTPGGEELERRFHAAFVDDRMRGEWFHPSPRLAGIIADILAGTFDPSPLPPPQDIRKVGWHPPAGSVEAGVMSRKVQRLAKSGVDVPADVKKATNTYGLPNDERDRRRAVVREWLAHHEAA